MTRYTYQSLLTDVDDLPIPQYLDTSDKSGGTEGTFKPMTQLQSVEDAATKAELESIKGTQTEIISGLKSTNELIQATNKRLNEELNVKGDMHISGSNVEDGIPVKQIGSVAEVHNETLSVTAGSISLSRTIKDIKYRYVFVGILENSNNVHSFSVSQFWYVSKESRAFNDKDMIIKSSTYRGLSSHQDVLGEQYRLQVNNDSDADQEYNIYVYGVM